MRNGVFPPVRQIALMVAMLIAGIGTTSSQTNDTFVGENDGEYTLVEVQLPISSNVPLRLNMLLAKWLFRTDGTITVEDAYKTYKSQFSRMGPKVPKGIKKINQHHFKLKWETFVEGRYASAQVDMLQRNYSKKKPTISTKRCLLYDLKRNRRVKMEDAFTLTAITDINNTIGGTRHELLVREPGKLVVQFQKDNKTMEATFSMQEHQQFFNKDFLELMEASVTETPVTPSIVDTNVYDVADVMPQFKGGTSHLFAFLKSNVFYPAVALEEKIEGKVIVGLTIDQQGMPQDVHSIKGVHSALDKEAIRAVKKMPAWNPGKKDGHPVAVRQTIPIIFKLPSKTPDPKKKSSDQTEQKPVIQSVTKPNYQTPVNDKVFVIILSNEHYQEEVPVEFAINDGERFSKCCTGVLNIPKENVHFRKDATLNNIRREMEWIREVANAYQGDCSIIIYYAGHGVPDEDSKESYLLPVDGSGTSLMTGYSLQDLYNQLGELPARNVTVFLDACFSGSNRGNGMLTSARGVAIKSKSPIPSGKVTVLSAAQGNETAYPYREKGHGLFTYFLVEKLEHSKGNITLGNLYSYVSTQVSRKSIVTNRKKQTPQVISSDGARDWKSWKFK